MYIYLQDAVSKYTKAVGLTPNKLRKVPTPFLDEGKEPVCYADTETGKPIDFENLAVKRSKAKMKQDEESGPKVT